MNPVEVESIMPNPFVEDFTVNYTTFMEGVVNFSIMSSAGTLIRKEKLAAAKGMNGYHFTENVGLAMGVYYLSLEMQGKSVTKKIIKL